MGTSILMTRVGWLCASRKGEHAWVVPMPDQTRRFRKGRGSIGLWLQRAWRVFGGRWVAGASPCLGTSRNAAKCLPTRCHAAFGPTGGPHPDSQPGLVASPPCPPTASPSCHHSSFPKSRASKELLISPRMMKGPSLPPLFFRLQEEGLWMASHTRSPCPTPGRHYSE